MATVLQGGLIVGILDGFDVLLFFGARGVEAARIFQYIASSLLGQAAFSSGGWSVGLGVVIHFAVACALTAIYVATTNMVPSLRDRWMASGIAYGLISYAGMNYIALPLTRVPPGAVPSWPVLANGVLAHVFLVGLPIALIVWRKCRRQNVGDNRES
ncbi:MAG: hypothetical protein H7X97_07855 [Opitutaceae bacterium]|nr:hypothetical protein [Verrucomicrobiales bacterium]